MPEIMPTWPPFAFTQDSAWGRCYQAFLREKFERSGSQSTLTHYRQMLIAFFTNPTKLPDAYSREDVERFIHSPIRALGRIGNPPGPGTMNNRLSCLNSFYSYAASYTIADAESRIQPVLRVPPPTLGFHQVRYGRTHRVLSASEVERFLAVIPKDTERGLKYRALFTCYLFTARRSSEILNLRWGDLEKTVVAESNGTRHEAWTYGWYGKGHARERDRAEMPGPAVTAIFAYLDFSGRLATMKPDDAIFTANTTYHGRYGYDPKRPMREQTIWEAAKRYARTAGIDEALVTIHAFRHVSARERYAAGSDIRAIQQLLRHTSLATTDIYLATLTATSDPGAKLLEGRFGDL